MPLHPSDSSHRQFAFCTRNLVGALELLTLHLRLPEAPNTGERYQVPLSITLQAAKGKTTGLWEHSGYLCSSNCTYSQLTRPRTQHLFAMHLYTSEDMKHKKQTWNQFYFETSFLLFRSLFLNKKKIVLGTFSLRQKKRFLVKASLLLNFPSLPPSFMFHGVAIYTGHFSVTNILPAAKTYLYKNVFYLTSSVSAKCKDQLKGLANTHHISCILKAEHIFSLDRENAIIIRIFTLITDLSTLFHYLHTYPFWE